MISVSGLTKRYGDRLAIDDLSFDVAAGKVTGFVGPNGAGKSTTMRAMVGLVRPDAGDVRYGSVRYDQLAWPARVVGAVLDAASVHPGRTARDHLRAVATGSGVPVRRVDEVLAEVGLDTVGAQRAGRFSLGMRQRLALAGALVGDPGVLLLDEPANGLDPDGIRWLRTLLRAFADRGGAVLVSSHLIAELATFADDLVVVGAGRLVAAESIASISARQTPAVVITTPQRAELAQLLARHRLIFESAGEALVVRGIDRSLLSGLAFEHRIRILEIRDATASLEDILLEMTAATAEHTARNGSASTVPHQAGATR